MTKDDSQEHETNEKYYDFIRQFDREDGLDRKNSSPLLVGKCQRNNKGGLNNRSISDFENSKMI